MRCRLWCLSVQEDQEETNGIRHLVWDTGRALDIRSAYTAGWLVLIATALLTAVLLGVLL